MMRRGLDGVASFPRKIGVTAKLGLAFATLIVVLATYGVVFGAATHRLRSEIGTIVDLAQPMSTAAYEMEVHAIGIGLGVMKYLHRPDPAARERLERDRVEFLKFLGLYRRLARGERQKELGARLEVLFRDYEETGAALIRTKGEDSEAFVEQLNILGDVRTVLDAAVPGGSEAAPEMQGKIKALLDLRDGIARVFRTVSNWAGIRDGRRQFEEGVAKVRTALGAYAAHPLTPEEAAWHARASRSFEAALDVAERRLAAVVFIDERVLQFIELRARLDEVLGEEIEPLSGLQLAAADAKTQATVRWTFWFLVVAGVFGALVSGLAIVFLSRNIIGPMRRLSESADIISGGDLSYRIDLKRRDELGQLAGSFDSMAERLEQAYGRLNETNAQLEAEVADRTRALELANDQLRRELDVRRGAEHELRLSKDAAEAASQAKSLFLANMSHELRTPLNAILGFSEVLKNKMFGPLGSARYEEYVTDINDSGTHLLRLINDVLDIARIESGRADLAEDYVDVAAVVATCLQLVEAKAAQKKIRLATDLPPDLPALHADGTRLRQILTNLFDNAVKFTPDGGEVRVSAARSPAGGICLTVADTGIGIAAADMPKVHEVFGQVDCSFSRSQGGAGLGLPLAKALVEKHGGTLTVDSEPGVGTTVTVAFPAERTVPHAGEAARA